MPYKRQILSLILLDRYGFQDTSHRQRRRHCLDKWVWKERQRWGFFESPHTVTLGHKRHDRCRGEAWYISHASCPGKARVRMLTPRLNLKRNHCLICGEQISPLRSTAGLEDLPQSVFLKEDAGSHIAGRQQLEIRILLSGTSECAFDAVRISKYPRRSNIVLLHVFGLFLFSLVLRYFQQ